MKNVRDLKTRIGLEPNKNIILISQNDTKVIRGYINPNLYRGLEFAIENNMYKIENCCAIIYDLDQWSIVQKYRELDQVLNTSLNGGN